MRKVLSLLLVLTIIVGNVVVAPTAKAIDLEPGECYQYTRYFAVSCGGLAFVTYETCMDEFGELHTEAISAGIWCP